MKLLYEELVQLISEETVDVLDLVVMLELTIEDILDRHPEAIVENAHKWIGDEDEEEEEQGGEQVDGGEGEDVHT